MDKEEEYKKGILIKVLVAIVLPLVNLVTGNAHWTVDTTIEELANKLIEEFDNLTKYQIIYETNKKYDEMICEQEALNNFKFTSWAMKHTNLLD